MISEIELFYCTEKHMPYLTSIEKYIDVDGETFGIVLY
jgi:hypothetical protein